jgi:hypothetical protein
LSGAADLVLITEAGRETSALIVTLSALRQEKAPLFLPESGAFRYKRRSLLLAATVM